jgi:RecB family endonuclease NucS
MAIRQLSREQPIAKSPAGPLAQIATFPSLDDPDLELDDRVYMLDAAQPIEGLTAPRQLFRDEKTLQNFIWTHHDWFPALRKLGLHQFEEQALLDSGRRVDFLCKKRALKQLVGIELKVREADDRAAGQLQQYLEDLQNHAKRHGYESAHLIVVSGQPDKSVRSRVEHYATSRGLEVTFLLDRVQMELIAHP